MKMMSLSFLLVALSVHLADSAKTGSCMGRCGEAFSRGQLCSCDLHCSTHNECCQDFKNVCPIDQSCRGRCNEPFVRGQLCNCDPKCVQFNTCCPDFLPQCDATVSPLKEPVTVVAKGNPKPVKGRRRSNSDSDERVIISRHPCKPGGKCVVVNPSRHVPTRVQALGAHGALPVYPPLTRDYHMVYPQSSFSVARPHHLGLFVPPNPFLRPRPFPFHDLSAAFGLPLMPYRGLVDDLCSDYPFSGMTALSNGTIVVFKGDSFWTVDPVTHFISRSYSIRTLGVPSYIDTVFTRANCLGSVYILKGNLYWRLDRDLVLEPGFPKPLSYEFPGLAPGLMAALAVPASVSRAESVYFFRRGDIMQRFTFPASNIPSCSISPRALVKTREARQTVVLLSPEIQMKEAMKGFPVPVTAALTAPVPMKINEYEHYVFSGPLFHSVSVVEDLPALVGPDHPAAVVLTTPVAVETSITEVVTVISDPPPPVNSLKYWLQCRA